jgi:hypothetical protein
MKKTMMTATLVLALGLMVWVAKVSEAVPDVIEAVPDVTEAVPEVNEAAAMISGAEPMGRAFTYQGSLNDAGSPADGLYDFQLKLFDDVNTVTGNQVGNTIDINDLDVVEGQFTVELDFGSDVFNGDARWLETTVAQSDGSDPCTLTPRVELTPTPYAIYAETAGAGHSLDAADGSPTDVVYVNNGGNVGIGTTDPLSKLSVVGTGSFSGNVGIGTTNPLSKLYIQMFGSSTPVFPSYNRPGLVIKGGGFNIGNQLEVQDSSGNTRFLVDGGGKVGIGTPSPLAKLHVEESGTGYAGNFEQTGSENTTGGLNVTTAAGQYGAKILNQGGYSSLSYGLHVTSEKDTGGYAYGIRSIASHNNSRAYGLRSDATSTNSAAIGGYIIANAGGGSAQGIYIDADSTSAFGGAIGIDLSSDSANGEAHGVRSKVGAGSGSTSSLYGIYSYGSHSGTSGTSYGLWSDVWGSDEGDSYGIYSEARKQNTDTGGMAYGGYFKGNNFRSGGDSYGVYGKATGSNVTSYGVYGEALGSYGTNYGVYGYAAYGTTNYAGYFDGDVRVDGNLEIYSGSTLVLELGAGLDYAEGFDVSDSKEINPGTVLIIDADNPGKLAMSDKAYDSKVAGIVAGANGIGSGVRLGTGEFDHDVALAGRVYCNVDATEAGVEPGDLLTTSATPGYAMKSTDYARAQGAILGKAMESLQKGRKGQILVLVTLQ